MESKKERESLISALSYFRVPSLNKEWDGKKIWLKAIVKVAKCDNSKNYAIADNDGRNNPHIVKDYGNCARIVSVGEIYPIYYLDDNRKPDLRNKADITDFLVRSGYDKSDIEFLLGTMGVNGEEKTEEQKKSDRETVKVWVNEASVKLQLGLLNDKFK